MKKIVAFLLIFVFFFFLFKNTINASCWFEEKCNKRNWNGGCKVRKYCDPTITPTDAADYCDSLVISTKTLNPNESLKLTAKAKSSDIRTFSYRFYNLDNDNKPIKFKIGTTTQEYRETIVNNFTSDTNTITVNFDQLDKKDMNWLSPVYGNPKPKNIKVAAYFTDSNNKISKNDAKCEVTFKLNTVDPTPTPNPLCICSTANVCTTYCIFDKFSIQNETNPVFSYQTVIGCNYSNFQSPPTTDQKNKWCRSYYRTKGDADGDGEVNFIDYFYYVAARSGAKLPPNIMPDFNGDNFISDIDKNIVIKSLKLKK